MFLPGLTTYLGAGRLSVVPTHRLEKGNPCSPLVPDSSSHAQSPVPSVKSCSLESLSFISHVCFLGSHALFKHTCEHMHAHLCTRSHRILGLVSP